MTKRNLWATLMSVVVMVFLFSCVKVPASKDNKKACDYPHPASLSCRKVRFSPSGVPVFGWCLYIINV